MIEINAWMGAMCRRSAMSWLDCVLSMAHLFHMQAFLVCHHGILVGQSDRDICGVRTQLGEWTLSVCTQMLVGCALSSVRGHCLCVHRWPSLDVLLNNQLQLSDIGHSMSKYVLLFSPAKPYPKRGNNASFLNCTSEVTQWFLYTNVTLLHNN